MSAILENVEKYMSAMMESGEKISKPSMMENVG